MAERIITGFHAIEEKVLKAKDSGKAEGMRIVYSKPGPRVKKILAAAKEAGIPKKEDKNNEFSCNSCASCLSPFLLKALERDGKIVIPIAVPIKDKGNCETLSA